MTSNGVRTRAPIEPASEPVSGRRGVVVVISVLAGLLLAVLWSAQVADDDIGMNVADGILGGKADPASITSTVTGLLFAFVTGVAGTFTACNIAVFSAVAPLADTGSRAGRFRAALRPLGWLALGAGVVAGVYGAIGALVGGRLPQLSDATVGSMHLPVRMLQSVVVFGVIGLIMLYLGLAAAQYLPDPLARWARRRPPARQVVMGALVGGFLIGRPWPLFKSMFEHAAATHNAGVGALTFVLIALGNIVLTGLLFLALTALGAPRWLRAKATRLSTVSTAALCAAGAFTIAYWVLRLPASYGIGWFPVMPWNS
jgi:MFS family permease